MSLKFLTRSTGLITVCVLILLMLCTSVFAATADDKSQGNRFVILSDLHPSGPGDPLSDLLVEKVIAVQPSFAVFLGDDMARDGVFQIFQQLRAAGIEIYPAFGNHDPVRMRRAFLLHQPAFNSELDLAKNPHYYKRFCLERKFYYSFIRGGIHFVMLDSTNGIDNPSLRMPDQIKWMEEEFCQQARNPQRLPTLVFLHHPEWLTGDRGYESRPIYRVLEKCAEQHTVKALFGGHWHIGTSFPHEQNLGIYGYAPQASILHESEFAEFVVATVKPDEIVFDKVVVNDVEKARTNIIYHSIPGRFTSLVK